MIQEKEYLTALKEAEELGSQLTVRGSSSSREHSLSFTSLQQSRLWAEEDIKIKESRAEAREVAE